MLSSFVIDLLNGRPLRVGEPELPSDEEVQHAVEIIRSFEAEYRIELPGEPPEFNAQAARWATVSLYLAASLVIHRNVNAEEIEKLLEEPPQEHASPSVHYSVDLTMRFLPSLFQFTKSASSDDPLLKVLKDWARIWPLSSVGIGDIGEVDVSPLRSSDSLMRLYLDRTFLLEDTRRLSDQGVRLAADAALGNYPELSRSVARLLRASTADSESN